MTSAREPSHPTTPRSDHAPTPQRISLRSPDDLLAAVPVVLGFDPTQSVAMLTFGGQHRFHARVDLSPSEQLGELVQALLEPARRHRITSAAFVVYTDDVACGTRAARMLHRSFTRAGIEVAAALRADGRRWWVAAGPGSEEPDAGTPYRVDAHPFRVQSVVDGRITHASREALAATLEPDPSAVASVAACLTTQPATAHRSGGDVEPGPIPALQPAALALLVAGHVAAGTLFADVELAAVAAGLRDLKVRDAAWGPIGRHDAHGHVTLWSDALRRTPPGMRGGVAAVLGYAGWLAGHGALAWCALDQCRADDPYNSLARLVDDLLTAAVPPVSLPDRSLAG